MRQTSYEFLFEKQGKLLKTITLLDCNELDKYNYGIIQRQLVKEDTYLFLLDITKYANYYICSYLIKDKIIFDWFLSSSQWNENGWAENYLKEII